MGSCRFRSFIEGLYISCKSLIETLYTLNSPPVGSFNDGQCHVAPWSVVWDVATLNSEP